MEANLSPRPQRRVLLDHLATIKDGRQSWKVAYPLPEVLFLVVCGTIASGDDYDDIVDWGEAHLSFLRGFSEFHHGIPCADWLRTVMNRIDPELFSGCFSSWVAECWPDKQDLVAIDGKTSRRSHDRKASQKALHLVSAFATTSRLVLGPEAVNEKSNEITAIPALLERIDLESAIVTIDAMGCQRDIAQTILNKKADYVLALKGNQGSLCEDVEVFVAEQKANGFKDTKISQHQTVDGDHGRIETRTYTAIDDVGWLQQRHNWPGLKGLVMVESTREIGDKIEREARFYITSAVLLANQLGPIIRGHWAIENNLHWTLDMTFNEDQSRLRKGHGAKNMAIVRHFALNLVRHAANKRSIKRCRKRAAWDPEYLLKILQPRPC
jgi:predicted transposase YbfD/YdcC